MPKTRARRNAKRASKEACPLAARPSKEACPLAARPEVKVKPLAARPEVKVKLHPLDVLPNVTSFETTSASSTCLLSSSLFSFAIAWHIADHVFVIIARFDPTSHKDCTVVCVWSCVCGCVSVCLCVCVCVCVCVCLCVCVCVSVFVSVCVLCVLCVSVLCYV
jgi:hypothetical protein